MATRPNTTWYGAYSGNYTNANRPSSDPINKVVIHVMQGSFSSAINWFKDSRAGVSCHYSVRSSDGFIGQSVAEADIAWHAGNWEYNRTSVGIEHEGYVSNPDWFTDAMYRTSARLTAYLCEKYRIPIDRNHIVGHNEVPGATHTDPGGYWNWPKYMDLVRSYAAPPAPPPPPPGPQSAYKQAVDNANSARFSASSRWVTSSWSPQRYGGSYRALETPSSVESPARFKVRIPSRGRYEVFAWWSANPAYTGRAHFSIRAANGTEHRFANQRINGGRWVSLGVFDMTAGDYWAVSLSSRSTSRGKIIADAVGITQR